MTLTKYQRGDQIEGWNDCPPMVMSRTNSSTSVLRSKNRRAGAANVPDSSRSSTRSSLTDLSQNISQSSVSEEGSVKSESECKPDEVATLVHSVLQKPTKLPERESAHYEQKLAAQIKTLSQQHLAFIHSVTTRLLRVIETGESREPIKKEVLDYMILHDGVSLWCSPLKKIVTSVV